MLASELITCLNPGDVQSSLLVWTQYFNINSKCLPKNNSFPGTLKPLLLNSKVPNCSSNFKFKCRNLCPCFFPGHLLTTAQKRLSQTKQNQYSTQKGMPPLWAETDRLICTIMTGDTSLINLMQFTCYAKATSNWDISNKTRAWDPLLDYTAKHLSTTARTVMDIIWYASQFDEKM